MAGHPDVTCLRSKRQSPQSIEAHRPLGGPWPVGGQMKPRPSRPACQATGNGDELPPDGLGHHGTVVFESEAGQPPDHVVGEGGEHGPGRVGVEVPRRAMGHACSFFQVPDGKLDDGMVAVVCIQEDDTSHPVGDEGVIAPRGEPLSLFPGEPGATDNEMVTVAIGALGHLCFARDGVVDRYPVFLGEWPRWPWSHPCSG